MKRLHWLCQHPTPYNDFLFRAIAEQVPVEFIVHFVHPILQSHPWQTKLAAGFNSRNYQRRFGLDWHLLHRAANANEDFFVIGGWNEPTMIMLINILITRGSPYAIWTDTPNINVQRSQVKSWLRQQWIDRAFRHAQYVMGTGRPALSALKQMGCDEDKLINFPFSVDLEMFQPASKRASNNPIFLSSGRLVNDHKGFDLAIRALSRVKKEVPTQQFTYRIAGVGRDLEQLKQLTVETGLTNEVEFLGWVEAAALPAFYQSGSIFLQPSHFDPFPNTVLEAMASGLIVVGSDLAGSVVDRISHSVNGFIHRSGDVDDLTQQILAVLTIPQRWPEISLAARKTAEEWPVERATATLNKMLF